MNTRSAYRHLTAVLFLVFAASGATAPLMSRYIQQLGADTAQIGLVFAVFQTASLASQYWWGQRSDRLGRRKPLLLFGTGVLAITYVLTTLVPEYTWLFALRIFEGLAFAAYGTGSLALAGDLTERESRRGRMMGSYRMFGSLAFAPAALFGGWLADQFGLRAPLLFAAVLLAAAFLVILRLQEPEPEAPTQAAAAELEKPVDNRALWPFLGLTFAWFFGMASVVSLWPVYMNNNGYNQTTISGLWALAALGEVPCLYLAGVLADRIGRKWVMVGGVIGMAFVYIAYTISTAFPWLLGVQIFRSLAYSCYETPAITYATELGLRQRRGRLAGLYHSASGVGGISGSAWGGGFAQQAGMPLMFQVVASGMIAISALAGTIMPRLRELRTESPEPKN